MSDVLGYIKKHRMNLYSHHDGTFSAAAPKNLGSSEVTSWLNETGKTLEEAVYRLVAKINQQEPTETISEVLQKVLEKYN